MVMNYALLSTENYFRNCLFLLDEKDLCETGISLFYYISGPANHGMSSMITFLFSIP